MRFVTGRFREAYRSLPESLQKKAHKALRLLAENPKHPSLRLKKIEGTPGIWEARVDCACRMTLQVSKDAFILRAIGKHDETVDKP